MGDSQVVPPNIPLLGTRQAAILQVLADRGPVRLSELAELFSVQPVTIRRDAVVLHEAGLAERFRGGLRPIPGTTERLGSPGKRSVIGVLVPSLEFYWPHILEGAEQAAKAANARIMLKASSYLPHDPRADMEALIEAGANGLLLAPNLLGPDADPTRRWLAEAPVPVVLVERECRVGTQIRPVDSVTADHSLGAEMAVHHLAEFGHRRIGLVANQYSPHRAEIEVGWRRAVEELGLDTDVVVGSIPDNRTSEYPGVIAEIVNGVVATGTTALIVHSDAQALDLVQRCEELRLSVPDDLSLIAYDDHIAALAQPSLTAVHPPLRDIGATAVTLLMERIARPERASRTIRISPTLNKRESVASLIDK